jgi:hypothetical protein
VPGIHIAAIDCKGRKVLGESKEGSVCVHSNRSQTTLHDTRVLHLVLADEDVQDFVNQTHGIDIAGRDNLTSHFCHVPSETPGSGKIGQNHIAIQGK